MEITIAEFVNADVLSDNDMLPVSQPDAYNPVTQTRGDTRKVKLPLLTGYLAKTLLVKKPSETQVMQNHLTFAEGKELLGTKADNTQANIAALKTYNKGQPDQVEQMEIGSETEHLNLNTDENGEYGNRISVDTKDPVTHQAKKEIVAYESMVTSHADQVDGMGRDLRLVFRIASTDPAVYIPLIMAEIRRRCNNNGEIDDTGIPDFTGIMIGDYIDGLDLSGIEAAPSGTAPQAWNDIYKNNRVVVSGFNTYKGAGDIENAKNHILFTFRNVICQGQMNSDNFNTGGYPATLMREWLEGADGDGTGVFATKLSASLGGSYLYTIRQLLSIKEGWDWVNTTVFLPSEHNVFGNNAWSEVEYGDGLRVHFPIYAKSGVFRIKRLNGLRAWWWESSPTAGGAWCFAYVWLGGSAEGDGGASSPYGGVAPAFCVA